MDPFSITISILTLATFCVQSSTSLYKAIDGLKSRKQDLKYLQAEVGDLNIVLQALGKNLEETTENFEVLRLILQQCFEACKGFEQEVLEPFRGSEGRLQEVKDWAKRQLLASEINNFRKLISSYKSTVTIALVDANLRTSKVTKQLLEEYTEMTKGASSDLEDQIMELSAKLENSQHAQPSSHNPAIQSGDSAVVKQVHQKISLEQCLTICRQLLDHIEELKSTVADDPAVAMNTKMEDSITQGAHQLGPRLTADVLAVCTHSISTTAKHLQDIRAEDPSMNGPDESRIVQRLNGARQCLDVVEKAQENRVNSFENITIAEDAFSTAVSTIGDLIKASGFTIGPRSFNIMGQMNDESLQKMSNLRRTGCEQSSSMEESTVFEEKYGFGKTISRGRQ